MSSQDTIQRSMLPIPDTHRVGLTTYDAKDPDTKFPPIETLLPPKGAPGYNSVLSNTKAPLALTAQFGKSPDTPKREAA